MLTPKIETEDFLLSITENCHSPIDQIHKKAKETLELKMIQSKQTFHQTTNPN